MQNGFLYEVFKLLFKYLKYLTLVEWIKELGCSLTVNNKERNGRIAVDIFILLKWIYIIVIINLPYSNVLLKISVWYLLITNLYSYFYYHIWDDSAINTQTYSIDRLRRRFVNIILAVSYSHFCFSYLYKHSYSEDYNWQGQISNLKAICFSVSSSLAANYDIVKPISELGQSITIIQLVITFIFLSIILSKSIPQKS